MTHRYYKHFKSLLKYTADNETKTDKPYRRYVLNTELDGYIKELNTLELREQITQARKELYINWLESYVIRRHDK